MRSARLYIFRNGIWEFVSTQAMVYFADYRYVADWRRNCKANGFCTAIEWVWHDNIVRENI